MGVRLVFCHDSGVRKVSLIFEYKFSMQSVTSMFTEFSKHKNVGKEGRHDPHPDTKAKTV